MQIHGFLIRKSSSKSPCFVQQSIFLRLTTGFWTLPFILLSINSAKLELLDADGAGEFSSPFLRIAQVGYHSRPSTSVVGLGLSSLQKQELLAVMDVTSTLELVNFGGNCIAAVGVDWTCTASLCPGFYFCGLFMHMPRSRLFGFPCSTHFFIPYRIGSNREVGNLLLSPTQSSIKQYF